MILVEEATIKRKKNVVDPGGPCGQKRYEHRCFVPQYIDLACVSICFGGK